MSLRGGAVFAPTWQSLVLGTTRSPPLSLRGVPRHGDAISVPKVYWGSQKERLPRPLTGPRNDGPKRTIHRETSLRGVPQARRSNLWYPRCIWKRKKRDYHGATKQPIAMTKPLGPQITTPAAAGSQCQKGKASQ